MKMKRLFSFLLAAAMMTATAIPCFAKSAQEIGPAKPEFKDVSFTGTFVQPWVYAKWSEERAKKEFQRMKDYGVDTLIMGDCATKEDGKWSIEYPSTLPEFGGAICKQDNVKYLLDLCKEYDIKLYLGLGIDGIWWDSNLADNSAGDWFKEAMTISAKMVKELYDLYKADYGDIFYGYYSVYEIWNHFAWNDDASRAKYVEHLSTGFNIVLDEINKVAPNMPLVFSPFASYTTDGNGLALKENVQKFYTEFFTATNFRGIDAFSPMDNIGGGGQTLEHLEEWTIAYDNAMKDSGNKLQFWSNCESFIQPKNLDSGAWTTAPANRYIEQVKITSKYASKILNFSYPHYMSPYNTIPGFDESYMNYLLTGEKDTTAPEMPAKVTTYLNENNSDELIVKWAPATDKYGIAQYRISKMNPYTKEFEKYNELVVGRNDGGAVDPKVRTSIIDKYYSKNGKNVYIIEAMDCSGNYSEKCYVVVDGASPNNGVDLEAQGGTTGLYTQAEFDKLNLTSNQSKADEKKDGDSGNMMIIIIACIVVALAVIGVIVAVVLSKKSKKNLPPPTKPTQTEDESVPEKTDDSEQKE